MHPPLFKTNSVLPVAFFFLNTFLLPAGLLYTTLLTPVFLVLLLIKGWWKPIVLYAILSWPLVYWHITLGAEPGSYVASYLLFSTAVIFAMWAVFYIQNHKEHLSRHFHNIVVVNIFFTVGSLFILPLPKINEWVWYFIPIHPALPVLPRLKLLVYEPSFYALQLSPIFLFYFLSYFLSPKSKDFTLGLLLVTFSLLLSNSFGVMGGLFIALTTVLLFHIRSLLLLRLVFFKAVYFGLFVAVIFFALTWSFPFNPFVDRLDFILEGHDPSANGRTWQAFFLAWKILEHSNIWIGAGFGQIKEIGHDIIIEYYQYQGEWANVVRLPNAMAETLATFGIVGVVVRIVAQLSLFFLAKVHQNYFKLSLFGFIFLYQFTGSYLTNVYEYLIWVLVFMPLFPQFDKSKVHAND